MAILGRPTLKRYFETGKPVTNRALADTIDSLANLQDTTAQTFASDIAVASLVTPVVSAADMVVAASLRASAVSFAGQVTHGVSGAIGFPVLSQRATALATVQFALLPMHTSIVGLGVKALTASSAAAGGTTINIGTVSAFDSIGQVVCSGTGWYPVTNVCARNLQGISGAIYAVAPDATAGASFLPTIFYYVNDDIAANSSQGGGSGGGGSSFTVTLSSSENNPNMVSKFIAAGWDGSSTFTGNIVINSSVIIGSNSVATAALDLTSATFPTGTTWNITNNGRIVGAGGVGASIGGSGNLGGPALKVNKTTTINNTNGEIWGGGGGGGLGGQGSSGVGGGGGGGGGTIVGAGGSGDNSGSAGTATAGGAGGAGAGGAGNGGAGGAPGSPGGQGAIGESGSGSSGGAAGKYIVGFSNVTFTGGSTSPNVKGGTS